MTDSNQQQEPHRQRCETCDHHKIVGSVPDIDGCDILDHIPRKLELKLIEQIGCASHSAATVLAEQKKTWESCQKHFTCPNGEECWYLSEDYHRTTTGLIAQQAKKEERDVLLEITKIIKDESVCIGEVAKPRERAYHEGSVFAYDRIISCIETRSLRQSKGGEQQ